MSYEAAEATKRGQVLMAARVRRDYAGLLCKLYSPALRKGWNLGENAATILKALVPSLNSTPFSIVLHLADWVAPIPRSQFKLYGQFKLK